MVGGTSGRRLVPSATMEGNERLCPMVRVPTERARNASPESKQEMEGEHLGTMVGCRNLQGTSIPEGEFTRNTERILRGLSKSGKGASREPSQTRR